MITIYIGGTDRTADIDFRSLTFSRETGFKNAEMSFRMRDVSTFPTDGDVVELWDGATLLFAGKLQNSTKDSPVPEKSGTFTVIDWYDILMEELVRTTYTDKTLYEIIQDIIKTKVNPEELKVMLQFEDGTGATAADSSQFENDAALTGGYAWDTTDHALDLDGTAALTIPDAGELDFDNFVTLCLDFTLDALNTTLLSKGTSSEPYKISVDASGDVTFSVYDGSAHALSTTDTPIASGTRYSIVCVFDRSTGNGSIYINGALNISGALTTTKLTASAGDLVIGDGTDGKFYRASVYAKVFSAVEARRWHLDLMEVKAPQRLIAEYSTSFDRIPFSYKYPAECFTELAQFLGLSWTIDERMFVRFSDTTAAAQTYAENDASVLQQTVNVETDRSEIRNAIFVRGGVYLGTWRSDQVLTDGGSTVYPLPYRYNGFELFGGAALAGSIQSWFTMNDASGNLADAKSANVLTASNLTYAQTGQIGNAIAFNGTTSTARKTSATHDTGNAAHSITAWIKPDVHDTTERIIAGFGSFAAGHSKLSLIQSAGVYYLRHDFGDSIVNSVNVGDLSGAWHLVGISYNPDATTGKTLKLFLDGALVSTVVLSSSPDIDAGVVEIGGNNGSNVFDGLIDEVTFFRYSLSDQEQEAVHELGSAALSAALLRSGVEFLDDTGDGFYNYSEKTYRFASAPAASITLYCTGKPEIPVIALRSSGESITAHGRRELEINDSSIESLSLARKRAAAELAKRKDPKQRIGFATHMATEPGATVQLTFPSFDVSGTFIVQKVTTSAWLPVESDGKLFQYNVECVNALSRDWIDFLRELARTSKKIDPSESDAVPDAVGHDEEITISDSHVFKTPTEHAEAVGVADAYTLNETPSGQWRWSNAEHTTEDAIRWGLFDW